MKFRNVLGCSLALGALAAVGCTSNPASDFTGGGETLDAQMGAISLETDLMAEEVLAAELEAMETNPTPARTAEGGGSGTVTRSFSGSRNCPAGGSLSVEAMLVRTYDAATGLTEADGNGVRSLSDCTFIRNEFTIVVNGTAQWEWSRRRIYGVPDGPQSSRYYGSFTAERSDGEVRNCEFDYSIVRDPGARSRTVDGTLCGIRFRRGLSWGLNG